MITIVGYGIRSRTLALWGRDDPFGKMPVRDILYVGTDLATNIEDFAADVVEKNNSYNRHKLKLEDSVHGFYQKDYLYSGFHIGALLDNENKKISRFLLGRNPVAFSVWTSGHDSRSRWFAITKECDLGYNFSNLAHILNHNTAYANFFDPDTRDSAETLLEEQGL